MDRSLTHLKLLGLITKSRFASLFYGFIIIVGFFPVGCKNKDNSATAFYYWKAGFNLSGAQSELLKKAVVSKLYVRFFDITWNDALRKPYPNAIISFNKPTTGYDITPVVYITNKTFEKIDAKDIDSLAANSHNLIARIATANHIEYSDIQFDCDWTIKTKENYFNFLRCFKKIDHHRLQVTIRLHQVKYKEITGVPPVERGVLMFYNMGKPNAGTGQSNSIYNPADAAKYTAYLSKYPLRLDVALPVFSWALHIRDHRIIQVYEKIKKADLNVPQSFLNTKMGYSAKKSFFLQGIYIKENDIFKLEQTSINTLENAAKQLSNSLPQLNNRTIIYYELANLDLSEFKPETLLQVSAHF